ncbi:MAG: sigma-70 family RNA polymerase sigma factor [Actinomycetota bacterium]
MAVSVVDPDAILIREHLGGERDAFDVLYRRYFPRLVRLCTRLTKDSAAAEDITQETLVRAHEHLARFDQTRPMWPWLKTIATRVLVDHLRTHSRELPTGELPKETGHTDHGWSEERDVLAQALSKLPPRQRSAVALRYLEDWDGPEVAEFLGLSSLAFRQILHRARRKLQTEYRRIAEPVMGAILLPVGWLRRMGHRASEHVRHLTANPEAVKAAAAVTAINLVVATAAVFGGVGRDASPSVARSTPPNSPPAKVVSARAGHEPGDSNTRSAPQIQSSTSSVPTSTDHQEADESSALTKRVGQRGDGVASDVTEPNREVTQPEQAQLLSPTYSPRFATDQTIYAAGVAACSAPQCPPVLFRSQDGGTSWTRLEAEGFEGAQLLLPPAYGSGDDRIFATGALGLEVSEDGGASFHTAARAGSAAGVGSSAISPGFNGGDPVILIGDHSLMQYRDDVKTIGPARPLQGRGPLHPAFSPAYQDDGLLLVGGLQVSSVGWAPSVFSCVDQVCSGSVLPLDTTDTPEVRLSPDFADSGSVYAFTATALFSSNDRGQTFSAVQVPWEDRLSDIAAAEDGRLFAALEDEIPDGQHDLYESPDGGLSWSLVDAKLLDAGVTSIRLSGSHALATLRDGGIACSADGGVTWATRCPAAT